MLTKEVGNDIEFYHHSNGKMYLKMWRSGKILSWSSGHGNLPSGRKWAVWQSNNYACPVKVDGSGRITSVFNSDDGEIARAGRFVLTMSRGLPDRFKINPKTHRYLVWAPETGKPVRTRFIFRPRELVPITSANGPSAARPASAVVVSVSCTAVLLLIILLIAALVLHRRKQ
jgi:hypothetical protein